MANKLLIAPRQLGDSPIDEAIKNVAEKFEMDIEVVKEIPSCNVCDHFDCVCATQAEHKDGCHYRLAVTCPIPISCKEHGLDVCVECGDVCNCEEL